MLKKAWTRFDLKNNNCSVSNLLQKYEGSIKINKYIYMVSAKKYIYLKIFIFEKVWNNAHKVFTLIKIFYCLHL